MLEDDFPMKLLAIMLIGKEKKKNQFILLMWLHKWAIPFDLFYKVDK